MLLDIKTICALLRLISLFVSFCLKIVLGFILIFLDLNVLAIEQLTRLRQPVSDRVALICTLTQGALFFTTLSLSNQGGLMMMISSRFENLTLSRAQTFEYEIKISVEFELFLLCRALCSIIYHLLILSFLVVSKFLLCVASFPGSFFCIAVGLVLMSLM